MAEQPQVFKYTRPDIDELRSRSGSKKHQVRLCRSDLVRGVMQVLLDGGENELHAHTGNDGFWMVMEGRVRYYTEGDVVIAELGKHEGVLIPRGFKYWFESVGEQPLELLHVAASAQNVKDEYISSGKAAGKANA